MPEKFRNKYRIESTRLQNRDYGSNAAYFVTICTKDRVHYFGDIVETQNIGSPQNNEEKRNITETQYIASQQQSIGSQQMQLSEIGKIANQNWLSIPDHFPFVKLGNHVIMPNHVHGIIIIDKPMDSVETQNIASGQQTENIESGEQETQNIASGQQTENIESGEQETQNIASGQQTENIESGEQETQGIAYIQHTVNIASWEQETQGIASLPPSINNKFGPQSKNLASIIRGYKSSVKTYATINKIDFIWQPLFHEHIIKSDNAFHRISEYILNNPMQWKNDTFNKNPLS
ncbi:hypothetical protein [Gelidibacter sp.]|uniref:hypothetical protein n=1 Tax=Gelidibacter sp. TaxID=2018083 RepID=UPI0032639A82